MVFIFLIFKCPERVFFVCDAKFADTLGVEICEADLPQALIARNEKYSAEIANGQQFQRLAIHFHTTSFAPRQTTIYGQMIYWDLWVGTNMWVPGRWLKVKYFGWHKFWERIKEANNFNFVFFLVPLWLYCILCILCIQYVYIHCSSADNSPYMLERISLFSETCLMPKLEEKRQVLECGLWSLHISSR